MKDRQLQQADISTKIGDYTVEVTIVVSHNNRHERSIDLQPVKEFVGVTFSGVILSGNRAICVHQIYPTLRNMKLKHPALNKLCDIWERWHLNDVRNGTRRQLEILRCHPEQVTYQGRCLLLESKSALKDRGFEYGTCLLVEPMPTEVETELRQLVADLGGNFETRST